MVWMDPLIGNDVFLNLKILVKVPDRGGELVVYGPRELKEKVLRDRGLHFTQFTKR